MRLASYQLFRPHVLNFCELRIHGSAMAFATFSVFMRWVDLYTIRVFIISPSVGVIVTTMISYVELIRTTVHTSASM